MKNAQKPDHLSLNSLINWLRDGRFAVPDFQREFEWKPWDIRDLMRSIFLDYYIGSLLLWRGKKANFDALSCEPLFGQEGNNKADFIVLDGQQRLTAIYYAFFKPNKSLPGRSSPYFYYVDVRLFVDEQYDKAFGYDRVTAKWKEIVDNTERQFAEHIFPLAVLGSGNWDLPNWVQGYQKYWQQKLDAARAENSDHVLELERFVEGAEEFGQHLRELTDQYQISYIELDREIGIDKVCDIFTQINSKGVRLDVFDLMNALLKPKDIQLKLMWRDAAPKLSFVEAEKMNVYVLQVMSLLLQAYCSPKYLYFLLPGQEKSVRSEGGGGLVKSILVKSPAEFVAFWDNAVAQLEESLSVLRHPLEYGVGSSRFLPYVSILPIFAAARSSINSVAAEQRLSAQLKLRKWYWASVFTNRYSGSVESTSARDFVDLQKWYQDDTSQIGVIKEFVDRFTSLDFRTEVKSGTSNYNGVFNILVLKGARDWITGEIPAYPDVDDHHIVPRSWNPKHPTIQCVLNRTPLTSDTNRNIINDRLPNEYIPKMFESSGEERVRSIFASHLISSHALNILLKSDFTVDDFEEFLSVRQKDVLNEVRDLIVDGSNEIPPSLQKLDSQLGEVELTLRFLIRKKLNGEASLIPFAIAEKLNGRLNQTANRAPYLGKTDLSKLEKQLEFADLRELEVIIVNANLWDRFASIFGAKELLAGKFNQLSELRNRIRHVRSMDDIVLKEGEAAIIWFKNCLKSKIA